MQILCNAELGDPTVTLSTVPRGIFLLRQAVIVVDFEEGNHV